MTHVKRNIDRPAAEIKAGKSVFDVSKLEAVLKAKGFLVEELR